MKDRFQIDRCEEIALYIIESGATVRAAASKFSISKSTVHKDITDRLRYINPTLHHLVSDILAYNKAQRHLRGGEATRQKYLMKNYAASREEHL